MNNYLSTDYIIKLLELPKVGRKTALRLINEISFRISSDNDLMDFISEKANSFRLPNYSLSDFETAFRSADEIIELSERKNIKIISFLDSLYPTQLKDIFDFPIILNYIGNLDSIISKANVAVIGTREATEYGLKIGKRVGEVLALNNINVVSGLALGCDTSGHVGALAANGTTTAVLAHGLDKVYPKENKKLAEEILEKGGVLISEYFIKQSPLANFFVERDRIQAGLSNAVLVIETDIKGGTMHTVKFCQEYKRILACINHPQEYLNQPKVQGNQMLIREGKAKPLFSKDDIDAFITLVKQHKNPIEKNEIIPPSKNDSNTQELPKPKDNKGTGANQLNLWE